MIKKITKLVCLLPLGYGYSNPLSLEEMCEIAHKPGICFVTIGCQVGNVAEILTKIHKESSSEKSPYLNYLCHEIEMGKTISTREIVENAIQEAIQCLKQLQQRLLQDLVYEWAEGLQSYLQKLLSNQVNIHVFTADEQETSKSIRPEQAIQAPININAQYFDPRDLYLRNLEVTGQFFNDTVFTGSGNRECLIFKDSNLNVLGKICFTENALVLAPVPPRAIQATCNGALRGTSAIDFQMSRLAETQVASGDYAVISGGQNNTASGNYTFIGSGEYNNVQGLYDSVSCGFTNSITVATNIPSQESGCNTITGGATNTITIDDVSNTIPNMCGYNGIGSGQTNSIIISTSSSTTGGLEVGNNSINGGSVNTVVVELPQGNFYSNSLIDTVRITTPLGIAITPDGQYAYVVSGGGTSNSVSVIDISTNNVIETPGLNNVFSGPATIAISSSGEYGYVTNLGSDTISVIDIANNTVSSTITVTQYPFAVALTPDGNYAYVTNSINSLINRIDLSTNHVTTIPYTLGTPEFVAITPDSQYAYVTVSNHVPSYVSVVPVDGSLGTLIPLNGSNPYGIAITPDGRFAYVANNGDGIVSVIDIATQTLYPTQDDPIIIDVGGTPYGVAITPDSRFVYVTNQGGYVSVIEVATNMVVDTINTSYAQTDVAVTPNGLLVYASNEFFNAVSVILTQTPSLGNNCIGGGIDNEIFVSPDYFAAGQHVICGGIQNTIINTTPSTSSSITQTNNSALFGGASVIGGGSNNNITGSYSVIPGGAFNTSAGNYSFVAGQNSSDSGYNNVFVWTDGSQNPLFSVSADNTFNVLATGGVNMVTALSTRNGVFLNEGSGGWVSPSSKEKKTQYQQVDYRAVLEKVNMMPVEKWRYKAQESSIFHMGPYAEDFYQAFGLGEDPSGINTVDAIGVLYAAVKGMYEKQIADILTLTKEMSAYIALLEMRIKNLEEKK